MPLNRRLPGQTRVGNLKLILSLVIHLLIDKRQTHVNFGRTKQDTVETINHSFIMTVKHLQPYLFFNGRCQEALDFYRTALGAEVDFLMHYKDSPQPPPPGQVPPGYENKVMHATFHVGTHTLMASDGCEEGAKFEGFSLSLAFATEAEAKQAFTALAEGGKVTLPLTKTFWSPCFGMLTDRFGIGWMVSVPGPM